MEIKCRSFSCHTEMNNTQVILANEARVDLLLEEIIHEKGVEFVLNAIGEANIRKYLLRWNLAA